MSKSYDDPILHSDVLRRSVLYALEHVHPVPPSSGESHAIAEERIAKDAVEGVLTENLIRFYPSRRELASGETARRYNCYTRNMRPDLVQEFGKKDRPLKLLVKEVCEHLVRMPPRTYACAKVIEEISKDFAREYNIRPVAPSAPVITRKPMVMRVAALVVQVKASVKRTAYDTESDSDEEGGLKGGPLLPQTVAPSGVAVKVPVSQDDIDTDSGEEKDSDDGPKGFPLVRLNACSVARVPQYEIIDVDAIVAEPLFRGKDDAYVSLVDSDEEPEKPAETPLGRQNACSTTVVAVKSSKGKDRAMSVKEQFACNFATPRLSLHDRNAVLAKLNKDGVDTAFCTGDPSDKDIGKRNAQIDLALYMLKERYPYVEDAFESSVETMLTALDEPQRVDWGEKGNPLTYPVGDKSSSYQPPAKLTLTAEKRRQALGFFDYHGVGLLRFHRIGGDSDSDNEDGEDLQTDIVIYDYAKRFPFIRSLFEPTGTGEGSAGGGTGKRPRPEEATDMAGASSSGKKICMQLSHIKVVRWNLFDILQEGNKYDDKSHKDLLILVLREAFGTPKSRSGRMRSPTSDRVFEWIMDTLRFIQGRLQDKFYKISGVLIQQFEISYLSKEQIEALATFLKDNCVHSLSEYKDYDGVMDSDDDDKAGAPSSAKKVKETGKDNCVHPPSDDKESDDDKAGAPSSAKKASETIYINEAFERDLFPILKNGDEVFDGFRKWKLLTLLKREFSTPVSTSGRPREPTTDRMFEWIMGSLKDIQKTSGYKFYQIRNFLAQHFLVYYLSRKQIEELANFLENNCVHSHDEDKDPLKF